ncbi:hypothetical protein QJS10_CPB21g00748 [Acorus calamus]|uniref:Uncharacterized protein n=1 Tax=Acorus calamus TaxID=4465 RepID=A0AAV9C7E7_ACOCL|nr:hypothetical protein QJS10_CPB21g00748 [Acorus calamus]
MCKGRDRRLCMRDCKWESTFKAMQANVSSKDQVKEFSGYLSLNLSKNKGGDEEERRRRREEKAENVVLLICWGPN